MRGIEMKLSFRNKKIENFVSFRRQDLPYRVKLLKRLDQLRSAPDLRTVRELAKCHRLQKSAKIEADVWALNVTANWRLCFRVKRTQIVILDYCDYH